MNAITKKKPLEEIRNDLMKMEGQFKMALPPNVTPEKFIRVALTAIQNTPDLLLCDRQSLYSSAMKCAADGLLPDGREAAFVKYNTKKGPMCQYMPMVGGIYKKLRNSKEIASLTAQVVYKNDVFKYWVDTDGEQIKHEPNLFDDRGPMIGVYAIAKLKDGGTEIEPMTKADVMKVKSMSKSDNVWSGPFESEMWRKTAIRRISKRLPMSSEIQNVIERDDELYDLAKTEYKNKADELNGLLEGAEEAEVVEESEPAPKQEIRISPVPAPVNSDPSAFENFK